MSDRPQCEATTKSGERCRTPALPGSTFCVFHDPDQEEACQEGRKQGGKTRSKAAAVLPPDARDVEVKSVAGVVELLRRPDYRSGGDGSSRNRAV